MKRIVFLVLVVLTALHCNKESFDDEGYAEFTLVGPQLSQTFRIDLSGDGGMAACFLPQTASNPETVVLTYENEQVLPGSEFKAFFPRDGRTHTLAEGDFQGMEIYIASPGITFETTLTERVGLVIDRLQVQQSPVPCLGEIAVFATFTGEILGTNSFGEQAVYAVVGEFLVQ